MTDVGLVLGAGGVVGQAYHAGVLSALHESSGWDARSADIIVGSSAGSITGTMLRLGVGAPDLAAMATGSPLSEAGSKLVDHNLPDSSVLPVPTAASWFRPWRPPSPALLSRIAKRPWSFRPDVAAMTMLPAGMIDLSERAAPLHRFIGDQWPEGLWICAVRRDDGARVVFGRPGSPPASLADAVLASCAIPAYFAPVAIGGVEYFDGGVHSPTSADVLRGSPPDAVLVISPMSAAIFPSRRPDALVRWSAHRRLEKESRRLIAAGSKVVRVEPGPSCIDMMGLRPMDESRAAKVAEFAYQETVRRIENGYFAQLPVSATVSTGS
jgi:NTE family protein